MFFLLQTKFSCVCRHKLRKVAAPGGKKCGPRFASNDRGPERSTLIGWTKFSRFHPAMIGRRCPVLPARRDGDRHQLRSRFTSAYLPRLRHVLLDLSSLWPRARLLQRVLSLSGLSPKTAPSEPASPTKSRGTTRSSRPSAGAAPAQHGHAKKCDGSIFPFFRCQPQDALGGCLSLAQLLGKSFAIVLWLASLHRLRPTRAVRWCIAWKREECNAEISPPTAPTRSQSPFPTADPQNRAKMRTN